MELSQQQSRINESKQKVHKPKRQPSMVASLAQKKRRLMENQEKELRERTIVKEGVQVYQQDNATVNEQRYRTEQYAMKSQNTQCKKLRKTVQPLMQNKELINPVLDVVYGDQDTPCRRKRKITQPHILNEETTHSDNDAAFEDQMNVHAVERNMQIDSVCAVSNETDNEM
ncbi:hypothetical protein MKX03_003706 [Papaver bracteatum]|nr:hypothetical protein MKX03_003706 [Papaver bracteatum]